MSTIASNVTLDALFRRNATLRGDLRALHDLDGTSLSYTETANAVAHVTEQIAALGLPANSTIALLLPNGRELIVATLAVMRSGHLVVPMPVAWRKSDLVRACREAEVTALITTANFAAERLPELAAEVAIDVFELSFPCAFGAALPDGLLSLPFDTQSEPLLANTSLGNTPSPGIGTLEPSTGGVRLVLHTDDELLAAGLGAMLAGDIRGGDAIVSAISFTTFAGLTAALVPWLLCSGTLTLLPDFPERKLSETDRNTHLIASTGSLAALAASMPTAIASAFAVHYAGVEPVTAFPALNAENIVDVIAIGEVAAIALPRSERSLAAALPIGAVHAGNAGAGSPVVIETRVSDNLLQIRGAIVPKDILGADEWLATGFVTAPHGSGRVYVTAPDELLTIGALSFNCSDLERRIRAAALVSEVYAVSDPILGARLIIATDRPTDTARALLDAGLPRIVAGAAQKIHTSRAIAS